MSTSDDGTQDRMWINGLDGGVKVTNIYVGEARGCQDL